MIANSIAGLKASLLTALTRKRHRAKKFKAKEFLMLKQPGETRRRKSGAEMLHLVELLNEAFGGEDKRKKSQCPVR